MLEYDLVGIGNAMVDVLATVDDAFLGEQSLEKGGMTLIDTGRSSEIYANMSAVQEVSGGSCGNTMAGFASLGGKGVFIGKVRDDQLGDVFRHDMKSVGVDFFTAATTEGPQTGSCLVLITPDAQRTMCTNLGAASNLTPQDIDKDIIKSSKVVYMEGYLFDPPDAQAAFVEAARLAHAVQRKVSITLSDPFCVDRHRNAFQMLVADHTDILFGNEEEIKSLYQVDDFESAMRHVRGQCEIICLTRGPKGSVILSGDEVHIIDPLPLDAVVDTTGAGDQFAAGFLFGYTQGMDLRKCGEIATLTATEVISHVGARPETSLKMLLEREFG
ncbi:MAG: adenosine kinase [Rickettsiales bacterium]|jgi:sugar/nucleoside kinase (ribokinase family)|nr:adenosine kinase [Rickettsiales bacterium]